MAADQDETFFDGLVPDINLLTGETVTNVTQTDGREIKKTPGKPKTPKPVSKSKQKENSEKIETKKTGRASNTKREPLKVLNNKEKSPKADVTSSKKEIKAQNSAVADSSRGTDAVKKDQTIPKIVVFQNALKEAKSQGIKKKPIPRLSKSCDSADSSGRRSLPEKGKPKALNATSGAKIRHSVSDLSSAKTQNPTEKLLRKPGESKKSPATPKFKSFQPEFKESVLKLKVLFPNADPGFLESQLTKFKGSLQETVEFLVSGEVELPSKKDYLKSREEEEFQETFRENFTVEYFVKMFPNPWEHFLRTDRPKSSTYLENSLHYLKNKYRKHYLQAIQEALAKNKNSLYLADKELSKKNRLLKMRATNRSKFECDASKPTSFDIHFMQEVAFIENEKEIKSHLKKAEIARNKKFKEAEKSESLLECLSCNNFSLLQDDAVNCPAHHVFCKECLIKYITIEMGKENFRFKCLVKCEEAFPVETLQSALTPPVVARIVGRLQTENIKPEGIENLVYCPFCYHIFIVPPEITVLKCVNPACVMESCRTCKKGNHVPWNCGDARWLTKSSLEEEGKEKPEVGQQSGESEQNEKESDLFVTCSGKFLKREVSDQEDRDVLATICSVCQQPGCSHDQPCKRSSRSLSFSSDSTEYAEITAEDDDDHEYDFLEFLSCHPDL